MKIVTMSGFIFLTRSKSSRPSMPGILTSVIRRSDDPAEFARAARRWHRRDPYPSAPGYGAEARIILFIINDQYPLACQGMLSLSFSRRNGPLQHSSKGPQAGEMRFTTGMSGRFKTSRGASPWAGRAPGTLILATVAVHLDASAVVLTDHEAHGQAKARPAARPAAW